MGKEIRITIGADIVPTDTNIELFKSGNVDKLIGKELKDILSESDFISLNLECPLINDGKAINKAGPHISADEDSINALKKINSCFYTLANNHIMDYGEEGLYNTLRILEENKIEYCGVGDTIKGMRKSYIRNVGGINLGIYCCTEHEFSIATDDSPGANPFDPLYCFDDIKQLRELADVVVVLYHGGKEYYRYPTPRLQEVFYKFVDSGANIAVAQHTHCIGCYEQYNGGMLVYGQGNFLFDAMDDEYWNTSLLIQMVVDENCSIKYEFIPLVKKTNTVGIANETEKKAIIDSFETRSAQILDKCFVKSEFSRMINDIKKEYFYMLSGGFSRLPFIRVLNKMTNYNYLEKKYDQRYSLAALNYIECETHREILEGLLRNEDEK